MKVVVQFGQTLADIAIQVYGSVEGVVTLAVENGLEITSTLSAGQILTYLPENMIDKYVVESYKITKVCPTTAFMCAENVFDFTFDNTFRVNYQDE